MQLYTDFPACDPYYAGHERTIKLKMQRALEVLKPILSSAPGPVLDVGCGDGQFLEVLRVELPHIEAAGHELPGPSALACRRKGLAVYDCGLEEISQRFSVVTMLDVAEHLRDPCDVFRACAVLLKQGGHIYVLTPRRCFWDNLSFLLLRLPVLRRLSSLWLRGRLNKYHLQLWSDKGLALALQQAGFAVVYIRQISELSAPVEEHARDLLSPLFHTPRKAPLPLVSLISFPVHMFIRLKLLKNKAECLAWYPPGAERRKFRLNERARTNDHLIPEETTNYSGERSSTGCVV